MKKLYLLFKTNRTDAKSTQEKVLEFVRDEKNIEHAAEGSMERRINLIDRVELRKRNA